jgi:hypothetical protein
MRKLEQLFSAIFIAAMSTSSLAQDATFNGMIDQLRCAATSLLECGPITVNQVGNNVPIETHHCISLSLLQRADFFPNGDTKLWDFAFDFRNRILKSTIVHVENPNGSTCLSQGECLRKEIQIPITLVEVSPPLLNSQLIVEFTFLDDGKTAYGTVKILPANRAAFFSTVRPKDANSNESEIMEGSCKL